MSPPAGTNEPSGSSKQNLFFGFEEMESFDDTAYETLPDEDRISWHEDDEVLPSAPLPASAVPSQPLSASPAMDAALAEISSGAPASRTSRDERRPRRGVGSYTVLRQNNEAMLQVEAAKKAKGKQPAPDPDVMDLRQEGPARNRSKSFVYLHKPRRTWCAVMIDKNKIMGNPFAYTPGWDVKVSLDPGTLGQPSVGLSFKFSKNGSADTNKEENCNSFAVGWEPGVEIGGQWMMEDLQCFAATNPADRELVGFTFPPAIRKLLDEVKDDKRKAELDSTLVCATFRSHVHKTSPVDPKWALALKDGAGKVPYDNLARMYSGEDPGYQVTLWFLSRDTSLERLYSDCLAPLANAVADHTPPFYQYLDENDEPFMDYRLPTVHEIGSGMYRRYPNVVDYINKRMENRSVNPTCFNLPKIVTWESIKTYYTSAIGPDMVKKRAQHFPHAQTAFQKCVSRTPPQDPTKAQNSPVELEILRLKDRHTLHRLAPS